MSKAWEDETKYNIKLTAREIRMIAFSLGVCVNEIEARPYKFSKANKTTLYKLWDYFEEHFDKYLFWRFRPDKLGRRGVRISPPIDKP